MELEEAIENLKEYKNIKEFITENGSYGNTNILNNSIKIVLKALENSVSKDIIREKIEELNKKISILNSFKEDVEGDSEEKMILRAQRKILQELLNEDKQ